MVRAPPCHGGSCEFESRQSRFFLLYIRHTITLPEKKKNLSVAPGFELNPTYAQPSSCTIPGSALETTRPTAMPHQEFVGLTKGDRRQVPHPYDKIIDVEGRPRLWVGFWQSRYKVPDHGAVHGLPYTVKENGMTQTAKSDDTALAMMQSIQDMPHRPNAMQYGLIKRT